MPANAVKTLSGRSYLEAVRSFKTDPLHTMRALRAAFGDLVYFPWPLRTLLVFHPDDIGAVMIQNAVRMQKGTQSKHLRIAVGNGVFTSEGKSWRHKRRILGVIFQTKALGRYGDTVQQCVDAHIKEWPLERDWDIGAGVAGLVFDVAGRLFFGGIAPEFAADVQKAAQLMGQVIFHRLSSPWPWPLAIPTPQHRRFIDARRSIDSLVYELIRRRRADPKLAAEDGVLGRLLADEHGLSDKDVRDEAVTLLIAGFETTTAMIIWTLYLLGQNLMVKQQVEDSVRGAGSLPLVGEGSLLEAVLKESMRLFPPSPIVSRQNLEPVQLGDRVWPVGTNFVMSQALTHRDPRFWADAESFKPARFLAGAEPLPKNAYFPFSLGPRQCVGEQIALREGLIVVGNLLRRFDVDLAAQELRPICEIILHPDRPLLGSLVRRPASAH